MINLDDFKTWLEENKTFSSAVVGDICSRLKRANNIKEWVNDDTYLFYLEKDENFSSLSVSVKSQIRRAVKLYSEYQQSIK